MQLDNELNGINVDVDFEYLINKERFQEELLKPHKVNDSTNLQVCVRKRPIFQKELQNGNIIII